MTEVELIESQIIESIAEPEVDEDGNIDDLPTAETLDRFYQIVGDFYKKRGNVDTGVFWRASTWYGSVYAYWRSKDDGRFIKFCVVSNKLAYVL